jgi:hypothetical protein
MTTTTFLLLLAAVNIVMAAVNASLYAMSGRPSALGASVFNALVVMLLLTGYIVLEGKR